MTWFWTGLAIGLVVGAAAAFAGIHILARYLERIAEGMATGP